MSLLKSLTSDDSIANEKDSVGGGVVLDSAIYKFKVAMAYINKASSGALGLVLTLKDENDRELRQTLWMTSGTAKGCKNYYEKDGVKNYLPGYLQANALCLLTLKKEISELDTETKVLNIYSTDAKAEVPTKVEVIMDLLNQEILCGVIKQTVDKTVKQGDTYVATGETREENEIDKFFRADDKLTTAEIRAAVTEPAFFDTWAKKWTGKVKNKAKGAAAGQAGTAGAPATGGAPGTKKPTTSLFG